RLQQGRRVRGAQGDRKARRRDRRQQVLTRIGAQAMATFVLVHGAYQGGWIWKPVNTRLRAAGHSVYAPTLDGCAERGHQVRPGISVATHAQEIGELLFCEGPHAYVAVGS